MITHDILAEKIRKAFGPKVPFEARQSWGIFNRERRTSYTFRYDWIQDNRLFEWFWKNLESLEVCDGSEWFTVYICHPDGTPLDKYN